jgi:cell pole-organizing protein PopZ
LNWNAGGPRDEATARPSAPQAAIPPLDLPPIERTPPSAHRPAQRPFDAVEEGYIEDALPDPGADDYGVAEAFPDDAEDGEAPAELQSTEQLPVEIEPARTDRSILSQEVAEATATAFDRLADTIVSQASGGARSIEDITRDLLRPMLKAWLDANLQGVVERLVREEIDRVARRSGR